MNIQYNRQQYLNHEVTHHEYYKQFVTPEILNMVEFTFSLNRLKQAYATDEHMNNIPLKAWDRLDFLTYTSEVRKMLREANDGWSNAGSVCILKTAARMLIEN